MANPFCCRGKLGALPLFLIGFGFLMTWHFMRDFIHETNSIRGSGKKETDINQVLDLIQEQVDAAQQKRDENRVELNLRNVEKESNQRPAHIGDQVNEIEADVEQKKRAGEIIEVEMMAVGEADVDAGDLAMADKDKIDVEMGKAMPKIPKQQADGRGAAAEIIAAAEADGAVPQDDAMIVAEVKEEVNADAVAAAAVGVEAAPAVQEVKEVTIIAAPDLADRVQLDLTVDGTPETMVLKMYTKEAPITVSNFETICNGKYANDEGGTLTYDGVAFHRIISGFMMQGGNITAAGAHSHLGNNWTDEKSALDMKHSKKGTLSMANAGPNTNSSQFFITFKDTPHLDGKHAVFGELESGFEVLEKVNAESTLHTVITKCSLMR